MAATVLVISDRTEDLQFGCHLAATNGFDLYRTATPKDVRSFLIDHPQSMVFWNADNPKDSEGVGQILMSLEFPPSKVFAVTDFPLNTYPHLFKLPAFGHHVFRRYEGPAPTLFAKLAAAGMSPHPFGLKRYFPEDRKTQKIVISRSSQKSAAVEAVQNVLNKKKYPSRLASLVAQSVDELLMNALFDAPIDAKGQYYRRLDDRAGNFSLTDKEQIELEIASTDDYAGVCVSDQFGSLKKEVLLKFLGKDYHSQGYVLRKTDPGAGLGLHGTLQAGLSLLFISKPKHRTEVMVFFPHAKSYKAFRESFRFLSIMT